MLSSTLSLCRSVLFFFREQEWFKIDLPEYLFPAASDVDASIIDTDVIREVCEVKQFYISKCSLSVS
jgi:hypothetical protein